MVCMEIAKNQNENILISSLCVMSSSSSGMNLKRINTVPLFLILISFLNALFVGYPKNKLFAHYLVHPETLKNQKNLISIWDTIAKTRKISFISLLNQLIAAGTYHFKLNKNKITCPTLFLVSKNDLLVPWTNSVALWHTVPMSQLQVFEGLGHDLSTDQPALIAKTLSHFFYTQEQAQINKA
jgi:pimeloyl-ACP methyl ester carboxylesterase